jgi:membrane protease YdiL (CAAX protease family)
MSSGLTTSRASTVSQLRATILLIAFSCAVTLRWVVSGGQGPSSATGGLVLAGSLAVLAVAAGLRAPDHLLVSIVAGTLAATVLVVPAALRTVLPAVLGADLISFGSGPISAFLPWVLVAATVAVTEEAFLRGALFEVVMRVHGETVAVVVSAVAFAAMHVPLYGWHVVPLDVAVGMMLGTLRVVTGGWTAPAVAHVLADVAGWWLG